MTCRSAAALAEDDESVGMSVHALENIDGIGITVATHAAAFSASPSDQVYHRVC